MRYAINDRNYYDFSIFELNKLPGRSYFIPYPDRKGADAAAPKDKRYKSEKVVCLNGQWDFKFYPRPAELPLDFDTDAVAFDKIDVPACWQFRGYDRPFYVNIRYQFPFKPPVIPTTEKVGRVFSWLGCDQAISPRWKVPEDEYNFVGVYRRYIDVADADKSYIISFLGVASCLDLYLNGEFIGYSEGSHNTAEFDLSGKLKAGQNELFAVVHRWCTGTYLESQDMFRNNGIFRDVLLRVSDKTDLWDINAATEKKGDKYSLTLTAAALSDTDVTFTFGDKTVTVPTENKVARCVFDELEVSEWSAEAPTLYDIYFETPTSCVKERIGFKTVEIRGDVFLLNGKKIKFKGVNHHDTSPTNGYTMTPDEIERDLDLCKQFNIDTVRTSHYPPDPLLIELADEKGIYIVDENDLETHGTFSMQIPPTYNTISHDPKWRNRYMDRIKRLYKRDKVHANTSIIMWSLGNEAGGYSNTDAMADYLHSRSSLPVHYESAVHCKRVAYDVGSDMYPPVSKLHEIGEHRCKQKELNDRPYFMCEYAHAMGVGPGNTEAYWKEIYSYDNLMGGCVWEMVDHAILHSDGSYTYGGDHGEWEHDSNFCVDGMFYPDRSPSVGAKIIRFIYRPIRVTHATGTSFVIFNTTAFSDGSRYRLRFRWNDGTEYELIPDVAPLTKKSFELEIGKAVDGNLSVIVETLDTAANRTVSEEQIVISENVQSAPDTAPLPEGVTLNGDKVYILLPNGKHLESASESTILYRAATDNDTDMFFSNTMAPYFDQRIEYKGIESIDHGCKVTSVVQNKKAKFLVTDTYEGVPGGVLVTSRLHCISGGGIIPRFGKAFRLDESFDTVRYHGRGGETYCDMRDQFVIGDYECRVGDMTEPNIKPQESGNRMDCTCAEFTDGAVTVRFEAVDKSFELGVKPYTDRSLVKMRHRSDEARTGTYVTIQAFQQGIGTGACGPAIMPEFQFSAKEDYELKFIIKVL
ncbi:MAG: hypothetical protein IJP67_03405, partial [Oscillospiraceae bacterium]|nr:hypothetical protein [Oscillospiraceae bacterium]